MSDPPAGKPTIAYVPGEEPAREEDAFSLATGVTSSPAGVVPSAVSSIYPSIPGYEILSEIARGGMGIVYRAHDTSVNRDVAVKVLQDQFRSRPIFTGRFREEGQITGQLQHPAIPAVHQLGSLPDGSPFMVMKLIKGDTLATLLAAKKPDRGALVGSFLKVAEAVGYSHSKGVIHRDLKPGNIMVGQFGEVQVMDWGLAKLLSNDSSEAWIASSDKPTQNSMVETHRSSDSGPYTQTGSVMGTPSYMSPEQAAGELDKLDERADVFGLGAVLCEILTGKPPYSDATTHATHLKAVRGQLDEAFELLDDCHADLELIGLCKRCLNQDRDQRPRNGGEVAGAVSEYLATVETRLRQAERDRAAAVVKFAEQRKRRRVQLALAMSIGLILFGGIAVAWWADKQADERKAIVLRQEIEEQKREQENSYRAEEDKRRAQTERERQMRNSQAIEFLLGQCMDALKNDEVEKAALPLDQARRRIAEGYDENSRLQLDRCQTELTMLRALDGINETRWTVVEGKLPATTELAAEASVAFRQYGVIPGETSVDEAARRVNGSPIRDRLLTELDHWLRWVRSDDKAAADGLLAILLAADSDPYRDAVRKATRKNNNKELLRLGEQLEALQQPPRFAVVLGQRTVIPFQRREQILRVAHLRRPNDPTVLMTLGYLYPFNQKEGAAERVGWYQAAVAVRPGDSNAWNSLGIALGDKGDKEGAVAASQEAIRRNPASVNAHFNLGNHLRAKGDLEGAIEAYREVTRLNPLNYRAYNNLGNTLKAKGDLDDAIAALQKAIQINPTYAMGHFNLGTVLRSAGRSAGDLDKGIVHLREAVHLNPKYPSAYSSLGRALWDKGDLDGAVAAFKAASQLEPDSTAYKNNWTFAEQQRKRWSELLRRLPEIASGTSQPKNPADALALAQLCQQKFQNRYVLSLKLTIEAFAADPKLADNLAAGHRYNSASAAVQAAAGKDVELKAFDVDEWGYLTGLGLKWLRADLAILSEQAKDQKLWPEVRKRLTAWKSDPNLMAVRDAVWLGVMAQIDRKVWESLWNDVETVLKTVTPEAAPPPQPEPIRLDNQ
jgi:tetratricopeptide (TPR) repeat protein